MAAGRTLSFTALGALLALGVLRGDPAGADVKLAQGAAQRNDSPPAVDDKAQGEKKEKRERPKGEEKGPPGKREPREEQKPHKSEPVPQKPSPPPAKVAPPVSSPSRPAETPPAVLRKQEREAPEAPKVLPRPAEPRAQREAPKEVPKEKGQPPAAAKPAEPHARGVPSTAPGAPADSSKHTPPGSPSPAASEPARPPAPASVPPATPAAPAAPSAAPAPAPNAAPKDVPGKGTGARHLDQIQGARVERKEEGRTVVTEPGGRVIIKQDNRVFIQHNEAQRFTRVPGAETKQRGDGITETIYVRAGGVRIVTEVDGGGRLVRRFRRLPDGREDTLIDNRDFWRKAAVGVGVGVGVGLAIALNLPPPKVTVARERYIVDYERASDDDLYETLTAPPVDVLDRVYSLEEVRYSHELRERMRRVDLDTITFDFGAFDVTPEQFSRLERIAHVLQRAIERHPDEVFLIEGHTDAVGSDIDNLSLSDRRAEAVAQVLTDVFRIPPENLVTQGYGEQFLKVNTREAERANRRVAVRRITPLMSRR